MLILRPILLFMEYLYYKIRLFGKVKLKGFTIIHCFKGSSLEFGRDVVINSSFFSVLGGTNHMSIFLVNDGGHLKIGNNVGLTSILINCKKNIVIGDNVMIGINCMVFDHDFHPLDPVARYTYMSCRKNRHLINKNDVIIEDGAFIGASSIITKGTHIGKNCVVGAGSVVHGNFPDNCVIAGNPAKIVRDHY